jgi:hypothetical protein
MARKLSRKTKRAENRRKRPQDASEPPLALVGLSIDDFELNLAMGPRSYGVKDDAERVSSVALLAYHREVASLYSHAETINLTVSEAQTESSRTSIFGTVNEIVVIAMRLWRVISGEPGDFNRAHGDRLLSKPGTNFAFKNVRVVWVSSWLISRWLTHSFFGPTLDRGRPGELRLT